MSNLKTDVLIIGAGPSGIFTALEMLKNGSKKKIMIVEKGLPVEKRHCPKAKTGKCVNCKPDCNITTGFSVRVHSQTASFRSAARSAEICRTLSGMSSLSR